MVQFLKREKEFGPAFSDTTLDQELINRLEKIRGPGGAVIKTAINAITCGATDLRIDAIQQPQDKRADASLPPVFSVNELEDYIVAILKKAKVPAISEQTLRHIFRSAVAEVNQARQTRAVTEANQAWQARSKMQQDNQVPNTVDLEAMAQESDAIAEAEKIFKEEPLPWEKSRLKALLELNAETAPLTHFILYPMQQANGPKCTLTRLCFEFARGATNLGLGILTGTMSMLASGAPESLMGNTFLTTGLIGTIGANPLLQTISGLTRRRSATYNAPISNKDIAIQLAVTAIAGLGMFNYMSAARSGAAYHDRSIKDLNLAVDNINRTTEIIGYDATQFFGKSFNPKYFTNHYSAWHEGWNLNKNQNQNKAVRILEENIALERCLEVSSDVKHEIFSQQDKEEFITHYQNIYAQARHKHNAMLDELGDAANNPNFRDQIEESLKQVELQEAFSFEFLKAARKISVPALILDVHAKVDSYDDSKFSALNIHYITPIDDKSNQTDLAKIAFSHKEKIFRRSHYSREDYVIELPKQLFEAIAYPQKLQDALDAHAGKKERAMSYLTEIVERAHEIKRTLCGENRDHWDVYNNWRTETGSKENTIDRIVSGRAKELAAPYFGIDNIWKARRAPQQGLSFPPEIPQPKF